MKKIVYFFICLFLITSCTKLSLGYKFGTSTLKSRLYDSFEFTSRDKTHQLNKHFDKVFAENKKPFFTLLKKTINRIQQDIRQNITLETVHNLHLDLIKTQRQVVEIYADSFSVVFGFVSNVELENYKKYVEEKNIELNAEAKDLTKFKDKKVKNFERAFDFLLNDITDEQLEWVRKFVDDNQLYYLNQINIRHKFNQELISLYPDKTKMKNLSVAYFAGDSSIRTDEYQKERLLFESNMKHFIVKVYKSLTVKQKAFLEERLFELIRDIDKELSE